jgi:hypothetical protein
MRYTVVFEGEADRGYVFSVPAPLGPAAMIGKGH